MTRPVPQSAIDLIKSYEKCVLSAYHGGADAASVWTIGWGHVGPDIRKGMRITQVQADEYLHDDIEDAVRKLYRVAKSDVIEGLTAGQYGALVSFVFNLGADGKWTIWKLLNAGKLDQIPAQLMRFVNSAGQRREGLVRRRAEEAAMWAKADPATVKAVEPSAVTRTEPTPPTKEPAKPLAKASLATKAASSVAAAGVAASQLKEIVVPHASISPAIQKIVVLLTFVIIAAAVVGWWIHGRQEAARRV